jgi:hypothetical protein
LVQRLMRQRHVGRRWDLIAGCTGLDMDYWLELLPGYTQGWTICLLSIVQVNLSSPSTADIVASFTLWGR